MRLALLTGGSRGLGLALCAQLQQQGFRVLEFSRAAPHPHSVALDLAEPLNVGPVLDTVLDSLDSTALEELLVFSNAATLAPMGTVAAQPAAQLLASIQVNLGGAIVWMARILDHFQHHGCRKVLVNLSSGAARRPLAGWSLYCAAKAGLEQFIRVVALEQQHLLAPFTAISIDPGVMDTDMQAQIRASSVADFPAVAQFVQRQRDGELRPVEQVAQAVLRIARCAQLEPGHCYPITGYLAPS